MYALTDEQRQALLDEPDGARRIDYLDEVIGPASYAVLAEREYVPLTHVAGTNSVLQVVGQDVDRPRALAAKMPGTSVTFVREIRPAVEAVLANGAPVNLYLDVAWDALHRCLAGQAPNTERLESEAGSYPLNVAIIGGRELGVEARRIINLVEPEQVADFAAAAASLDAAWCAARYWTHCEGAFPEYGQDDMEFTCEYFVQMRGWFAKVAETGRAVLFEASQ